MDGLCFQDNMEISLPNDMKTPCWSHPLLEFDLLPAPSLHIANAFGEETSGVTDVPVDTPIEQNVPNMLLDKLFPSPEIPVTDLPTDEDASFENEYITPKLHTHCSVQESAAAVPVLRTSCRMKTAVNKKKRNAEMLYSITPEGSSQAGILTTRMKWTTAEDAVLAHLCQNSSGKKLTIELQKHLNHRTPDQCRWRWSYLHSSRHEARKRKVKRKRHISSNVIVLQRSCLENIAPLTSGSVPASSLLSTQTLLPASSFTPEPAVLLPGILEEANSTRRVDGDAPLTTDVTLDIPYISTLGDEELQQLYSKTCDIAALCRIAQTTRSMNVRRLPQNDAFGLLVGANAFVQNSVRENLNIMLTSAALAIPFMSQPYMNSHPCNVISPQQLSDDQVPVEDLRSSSSSALCNSDSRTISPLPKTQVAVNEHSQMLIRSDISCSEHKIVEEKNAFLSHPTLSVAEIGPEAVHISPPTVYSASAIVSHKLINLTERKASVTETHVTIPDTAHETHGLKETSSLLDSPMNVHPITVDTPTWEQSMLMKMYSPGTPVYVQGKCAVIQSAHITDQDKKIAFKVSLESPSAACISVSLDELLPRFRKENHTDTSRRYIIQASELEDSHRRYYWVTIVNMTAPTLDRKNRRWGLTIHYKWDGYGDALPVHTKRIFDAQTMLSFESKRVGDKKLHHWKYLWDDSGAIPVKGFIFAPRE